MTRQPIRFTQIVTVKDTSNVDREITVGDNSLNGICYLQNIGSGTKYYGLLIADGWYDFGDIPDGFYKLFREVGTAVTRWHGTGESGRWIGDGDYDASAIISGTLHVDRIPNLSAGKITSDTLSEARLPSNINALRIASGLVGNSNFDKLSGAREVIQTRLDLSPTMQSNMLIVDSTFVATSVNKFNTIQAAINYAQSLIPSVLSPWFLYIMPNNDGGYVENITLQPHVHLIGMGMIHITGTVSGGSLNSLLQNIYLSYQGNSTVSSVKAINSIFRVTNDDTGYQLTLGSNILVNCGLLNVGSVEFVPRIISSGNNTFVNCWSNISCEAHSTDKGKVDSLEDYSINI